MSARFRGTAYRTLLPKLPRNLVVFDGHCLMCQKRIQFVIERNFSFFGFLTYFSSDAQTSVNAGLDRHTLYFASLDSMEGSDIKQMFLQKPATPRSSTSTSSSPSAAAASTTLSPLLPYPEDLVLICIEKVPSKSAAFLRRVGGRVNHAKNDAELFVPLDPVEVAMKGRRSARAANTRSATDVATSALADPEATDLFVTTNYLAMCRVGMHLDRTAWRTLFRVMYYTVPRPLGDWLFQRFVSQRRHTFWGHSEEDAVKQLGRIEGMKERRWAWRTHYPKS